MYKLFLDIDGVLADFIDNLNFHLRTNVQEKNVKTWDLSGPFKKSRSQIKRIMENDDFWITAQKTIYCDPLIKWLTDLNQFKICLLTTPAYKGATGKQIWIKDNLPKFYNSGSYLIGPAKKFCASSDSILIDDNTENYLSFRINGGTAILFPRPWNENRADSHNPEEFTKDRIILFLETEKARKENTNPKFSFNLPDIDPIGGKI